MVGESLGFLKYRIISSASKDNSFSSFPTVPLLFLSLDLLLWLKIQILYSIILERMDTLVSFLL
jgi:hypothetical protein